MFNEIGVNTVIQYAVVALIERFIDYLTKNLMILLH